MFEQLGPHEAIITIIRIMIIIILKIRIIITIVVIIKTN